MSPFFCMPAHSYDVLVVKSDNLSIYNDAIEGFINTCKCNVKVLSKSSVTDAELLHAGSSFDALFVIGTRAYNYYKDTAKIPVFYTLVLPNETSGYPHKNITGVIMSIPPEKYIGVVLGLLPNVKKIGVIYDPVQNASFLDEAMSYAHRKGVYIVPRAISSYLDIPAVINDLQGKIDLLWMIPDVTLANPEAINQIFLFTFNNKIPVLSFSKKYIDHGALAALEIVPYDMGAQAGEMMLNYMKSGLIKPPQRPKKYLLYLNRRAADRLRIKIDDVISDKAIEVKTFAPR